MRRIVPLLSAVAFAGVLTAPMLMSSSTASASAPTGAPYCLPHVLPAPLDILEYQRDSYSGSFGLGQC